MQKPRGTSVATVTQFPGASIGVGAPSERAGAPDIVASPPFRPPSCFDPSLSRFFFFPFFSPYFSFYAAGLKPKVEPTGEKSKSLARGSFLPIHAAPSSSRETSSAKCPTKIGICREYRIPEVRSGLRVELLKVLPRPSNFVSPYRSAFPRIFPPAASAP